MGAGKKKTEDAPSGRLHLEGQDKDIFGFDLFFLDAGRGQVDILAAMRAKVSTYSLEEKNGGRTDPSRIEIPPPVPVTQPSL